MVPPSFGALQATLEPESSVMLGEGVRFEVNRLQGTSICTRQAQIGPGLGLVHEPNSH